MNIPKVALVAPTLIATCALLSLTACNKAASNGTTLAASNPPSQLPIPTEAGLLETFRRAGASAPDFVSIASVKFKIVESSPPTFLLSGKLTYAIMNDTFRSTRRITCAHSSFTLIEPVKHAGDTLEIEFSQRVSYQGPGSAIVPPAPSDWEQFGQPKVNFSKPLLLGSPEAAEAIRQEEAYTSANETLYQIQTRARGAAMLLYLVSDAGVRNENDEWNSEVNGCLNTLGYPDVVKQMDDLRNRTASDNLPRVAFRRKVIDELLKAEIIPEAEGVKARATALNVAVHDAVKYFEQH